MISVISTSENSSVAACRTTEPEIDPQAMDAADMVGISALEKASIWPMASLPRPIMEAVSEAAISVIAATPIISAVLVMAVCPD